MGVEDRVYGAKAWIDAYRDVWLDLIRVYLGIGLFVKGIFFVRHVGALEEQIAGAGLGFGGLGIAHYVAIAHICGGLLLAIGLVTRLAAAVQVPVLIGAVLLAAREQGFFAQAETLELTVLILFLLLLFTFVGGGRLSVDAHLRGPRDIPGARTYLDQSARTT